MRPQRPRTTAPVALAALVAALGSLVTARPSQAAERAVLDLSAGVFQATDPSQTGFLVAVGARLLSHEHFSLAVTADYVRMQKDVVQAVSEAGGPDVVLVEDNQSRHYIPVFLTANFGFGDDDHSVRPYLIGSIGWATLRSYHENSEGENSRSFFGPVFEGGLGLQIHSRFFVEGSVHAGSVERSNDERRPGTPVDEEAKPTGVAIRAGFRL